MLAATLIVLALAAVSASAKRGNPQHLAPPGNPAVSQYLEDVPSDQGAAPPRSGGAVPTVLSVGQRKKLNRLGADGRLLVQIDNETAPVAVIRRATHGRARGASRNVGFSLAGVAMPRTSAGAGSSISAVLSAAAGRGGGGGVGVLLPALMGGGLLVLVWSVVRRRGARRS